MLDLMTDLSMSQGITWRTRPAEEGLTRSFTGKQHHREPQGVPRPTPLTFPFGEVQGRRWEEVEE